MSGDAQGPDERQPLLLRPPPTHATIREPMWCAMYIENRSPAALHPRCLPYQEYFEWNVVLAVWEVSRKCADAKSEGLCTVSGSHQTCAISPLREDLSHNTL